MERAIVVRGKLADAQHIELDEPVTELEGPVEVVLRRVPAETEGQEEDIFDFIAKLPPGTRSKEDIDRQIRKERESWGDR
ncbi:MAG: hypothetical protein ACE5I7_17550 [Candidatus Binatia bacterium]